MGPAPESEELRDVCELGRWIGHEQRDLAVLGEGNVSIRIADDLLLVKASGTFLADTRAETMVEMRISPILELLSTEDADDSDVETALLAARVDAQAPAPSVETLLHAVALTTGQAAVVAHSHPQSVNAILCSGRADALVAGALFPDQIVVLGRRQILLPYLDPGLELARAARRAIERFMIENGERPRAIYLANHGFVALGSSAAEARRITQMADKSARILRDALSIGDAVYLSEEHADRIHSRPDELLRRRILDRGARPIPVGRS